MIHARSSNRSGDLRRVFPWRVCTVVALLLLVVAALSSRYVLGYRESGEVTAARDLPVIGARFSAFGTTGPIAYSIFHHPHGACSFLLCGYASEDEVCALCRRVGVYFASSDGDEFNRAYRDTVAALDDATRVSFWKGPFAKEDRFIYGNTPDLGSIIGAFRARDGFFAISLSAVQPYVRETGDEGVTSGSERTQSLRGHSPSR